MKEFWAIFPISSILVIRSGYAKKDHFSILPVIQNIWDLHKFGLQIWIQKAKISLWKNFRHFFRFHQFWSSGPRMRKKASFQYLLYFKMYGIYINMGCRFEFRMQKLPYERISGNFFRFHQFGSSGMRKKAFFPILAVIQNICDFYKSGLQMRIHNAEITLWKNFGQFFWFHQFWSSCEKRSFLNISCILKCMWFTWIWVANLNSERKNYPMKEFRAIFSISSILVIRSGYAKKDDFSILAVIQNIWDLHKFGLQIWIQNAKISLWKNFRRFFRFHQFWSSGPRMRKKANFQY